MVLSRFPTLKEIRLQTEFFSQSYYIALQQIMYNQSMSQKAQEIIKDVNATMTLEGLPLSDLDIELLSKTIDGEITREEAFAIFNSKLGIDAK